MRIKKFFKQSKKLKKNQAVMLQLFQNASESLNLRMVEIHDDVGKKPTHLKSDFDATSLWVTVDI